MNIKQQHKKIRLAGNDDCNIVLCPACQVVELNLGAATVRIHPENLHTISTILLNAQQQLVLLQPSNSKSPTLKLVSKENLH